MKLNKHMVSLQGCFLQSICDMSVGIVINPAPLIIYYRTVLLKTIPCHSRRLSDRISTFFTRFERRAYLSLSSSHKLPDSRGTRFSVYSQQQSLLNLSAGSVFTRKGGREREGGGREQVVLFHPGSWIVTVD